VFCRLGDFVDGGGKFVDERGAVDKQTVEWSKEH
jgi:hypothetical protein